MNDLNRKAAENLEKIREEKPLIHNITNYVVMNFTANVLLSLGASPVMAHAENEVEDMAAFAKALVINIGTLSDPWIDAMVKAGKKASDLKTPVILDPVGSGATPYRTETAKRILDETDVTVVRGNASEILSLCSTTSETKGVDSVHSVSDSFKPAIAFAKEKNLTVAITGAEDIVTDGNRIIQIKNGDPMLANITGTGCSSSAVTGAFCSVDSDPVSAAATALAFFGLAGEKAAETAKAPGSFMISLIDALYTITPEELDERAKIEQL